MRDDDVRLSEGERAAFDDLARRLADGAGRDGLHARTLRLLQRPWASWLLFAVGCGVVVTGLLTGDPWLGGAGFVGLLVAMRRLTRRWNWVRTLLWWRRTAAGPPRPPPEHMGEP